MCACTHARTMMLGLFSDLSPEEDEVYDSVTQKDILVELLVCVR
jgi:hypothetical protein